MANLRSLIGREYASTLDNTIGEVGSLDMNNEGRVFLFRGYCGDGNCNSNYWEYCLQHWCVPCGTTQVTFELWGGGGSGGGGCCCQQGFPGGAGSYVRKTLEYPLVQGGWCYSLCTAPPTCCSRCCCGIQGCKTWVQGCNLSNLCADGGLPGKTCCYAFWSNEFRCKDKVSFDGCGGWSLLNCCACAYGGDFMAGGKPSWFRTSNSSSNCWAKAGFAIPYGLVANGPTYQTVNYSGDACHHEYMMCRGTTPYAFNVNCGGKSGIPGKGGPSATSCGGGCCYGRGGASGMIKITYCSCWIHGSDRRSDGNQACSCFFYN